MSNVKPERVDKQPARRVRKVPVTVRALVQRINRALEPAGKKLKAARGARARADLGDYYVSDLRLNVVVTSNVDIGALGRKLGVLEELESISAYDFILPDGTRLGDATSENLKAAIEILHRRESDARKKRETVIKLSQKTASGQRLTVEENAFLKTCQAELQLLG